MRNFLSSFAIFLILASALLLTSCGGWDPASTRDVSTVGPERARKNVEEGRGVSLKNLGKSGSTNYEFSTSNPMWRASLEILDFLPLATVDYSGGIIITDWYAEDSSKQDSIKISLRFLGNDIRSESLKVIVHKKKCSSNQNCIISLLSNSKIKEELHTAILRKAALIEKESKKKK